MLKIVLMRFFWCLCIGSLSGNLSANRDIESTGNVLDVLIISGGLATTLLYEDDFEGSRQFVESLVVSQVVTGVLKAAIHKTRPNGECCDAFPSGHTARAFMGAGFIQKRYGWEYAVPVYMAATVVGYSRVDADQHDVKDVLAGAVIGLLSSFTFTEHYSGISISPIAGSGFYGISINNHW